MARLSEQEIALVRSRASIVDVISHYISLSKKGRNYAVSYTHLDVYKRQGIWRMGWCAHLRHAVSGLFRFPDQFGDDADRGACHLLPDLAGGRVSTNRCRSCLLYTSRCV